MRPLLGALHPPEAIRQISDCLACLPKRLIPLRNWEEIHANLPMDPYPMQSSRPRDALPVDVKFLTFPGRQGACGETIYGESSFSRMRFLDRVPGL
jgi:hypothetical protein